MAFVKLADNYTDLIGKFAVALLAEGVDRNTYTVPNGRDHAPVALLAEGVDRNKLRIPAKFFKHSSPSSRRAWIEIDTFHTIRYICRTSPSSRRAWIEIRSAPGPRPRPCVALLAEGVDRNYVRTCNPTDAEMSPSSRRAWIEIGLCRTGNDIPTSPSSRRAWIEIYCYVWSNGMVCKVALLAEGVDRNA